MSKDKQTDDETTLWVVRGSRSGGRRRNLHDSPDCWTLERAERPIVQASDTDRKRLEMCSACEEAWGHSNPGEGHYKSLLDAASDGESEQ